MKDAGAQMSDVVDGVKRQVGRQLISPICRKSHCTTPICNIFKATPLWATHLLR
jgi:hypothetical protein